MKKYIVILVVGFLLAFAGNSEARGYARRGYGYHGGYAYHGGYGYRGGYYGGRGYYCAPRPYVAYRPYYYAHIWVPGYWTFDAWGRRIWISGYWR